MGLSHDGLEVSFCALAHRGRGIVACILSFIEREKVQLCVTGSLQLMKVDQDEVLGSVAQASRER